MKLRKLMFVAAIAIVGMSLQAEAGRSRHKHKRPRACQCERVLPMETKVNLGAIKAAISIYYGDTEGEYPASLTSLVPQYLPSLPNCVTPWHGTQSGVQIYSHDVTKSDGLKLDNKKILGTGKWGYVYAPGKADHGLVFIDSKHCDSVYMMEKPDAISTRANLGVLRSALSIYYGDTEGLFAPSLSSLVPKYINRIPQLVTPCKKAVQSGETTYSSMPQSASELRNTGKWAYIPSTGEMFIDCSIDDLWKL